MDLSIDQINKLKELIRHSLYLVYQNDALLISRKAHERSVAFRFGLYLSELLLRQPFDGEHSLTVDLDYNRNGKKAKYLGGFIRGVLPNIILHHRGHNDKNVLVIEFKGYWSKANSDGDDKKLRAFTEQSQSNDYCYGLGVFIKIGVNYDACSFVYYKNGDTIN